jgi:hypothetical protein
MSIAGRATFAFKAAVRAAFPFLRRPGVAHRLHVLADALRDVPFRLRGSWRGQDFAIHVSRRNRRVAFVTEDGVFKRELKIAYALKKAGWDVLLLHRNAPLKAIEPGLFAEIQHYRSPMEAVSLARTSGARLFHYFSNAADTTGRALVDNKPGRVIVDYYDYYFGESDGLPIQEAASRHIISDQAYCLARADAVTTKDLQLCYRRRETGVGRGKPLLYFPNYCWNRGAPPPQQRSNDGGIHIVQAAGMGFETRGSEDIGSFRVIREFVMAGCHIHIYMIPGFGATIEDPLAQSLYANYIALKDQTQRVHFEPVVPPHILVEQLSRYDYGFNMLNAANFDIPWANHNPVWLGLLSSGRLFDYLDAGIGMIVDGMLRFNRHLFGPTGAYIDGTALLRSGTIMEGLRNSPPRATLLQARATLGVERHINRLTRFYEQLD